MKRRAHVVLWSVSGIALCLAWGCRRGAPSPRTGEEGTAPRPAAAAAAADPLAGVVDPWTWPRAAGASDREQAIEDIGPYEPLDRTRPDSPIGSPNAHYWTTLVGLAWDRDVAIDFDDQPVDLDGDGLPDTRVTRHVHAKGGILANPALFGLVATPDDPRGRVGRVSASTGVLGLREALTPDGRRSGQIGMTCFLCHGGIDPDRDRAVLGLPGAAFDYGLLLATAAILDDGNAAAAAHRRAHGYPDGRTVRARLLLAGPGRQDLTGEFGLDVTVPGTHSAHYAGTRRVRQGTTGIVNPISVPGILAASGMDLQNWSGSEVASARWLRRLIELGAAPPHETLRLLGLPGGDPDDARASAAARRALLLDLRNLGTLGLQQDSFPGLLWADAIYGHTTLRPAALASIPRMYGTAALRRMLAGERLNPPAAERNESAAAAAAVARGRDIFANRVVGVIANRQILKEPPALYAAAKPGGPAHTPLLAPIDDALPSTFPVRCADCHSATPGGAPVALAPGAAAGPGAPPFGRCGHCHRAHTPFAEPTGGEATTRDPTRTPGARLPLAAMGVPAAAPAEVSFCARCHDRHRPFSPVVYSSSLLLPFDADGDGKAQDDEAGDGRAGGIGTEALLAFDVPRPQRPATGFALDLPSLSRLHEAGPITTARVGAGWVRVPPLLGIRATAPYLHNGSVPTLRALLDPAARRPRAFALGPAGFVLDTRLPGNRNTGHEFGTALGARDKADLIAFLRTL
ncbi:MAG: hypothetical protein ABUS79_07865 [Pseudomonadota bacterium]